MKLFVEKLVENKNEFELVERKGLGHPDTICDSICESISISLCKEYLEKFGFIAHHNIDKGLLAAGESRVRFGGGEVTKPMKMIVGDRATREWNGIEIDLDKIIYETTRKWFLENLRFVKQEHFEIENVLKPTSPELARIFKEKDVPGSNDTSAAFGYYPLSELEKIVLDTELYLNSKDYKKSFPETGEDIKIMGIRKKKEVELTIAMSFIDSLIESEEDYFRKKEEVLEDLKDKTGIKGITLNNLDKKGFGLEGIYLTVTGTSAESGDSGQVGRGNRVNGVISFYRPFSSEAAAGKNPVAHIGKIYNVLSHVLAKEIYEKTGEKTYIWIVNKIGNPIDDPLILIRLKDVTRSKEVEEIINKYFSNLRKFCLDLAKGKYKIC
ncbi:MAG: methionine adenosyltransferase [archaeon]